MTAETINMRTDAERKRRLPAGFFDTLAPEPTPALLRAGARLGLTVHRDR